jgi:GH25 family lysozyme M1 (1,4-beta-N-acetylmuramidase)
MTANEYNERRVMSGDLPQSVLEWAERFGGVSRYQGAMMLDVDGKLGPQTQRSIERKIAEDWQPLTMIDLSHHNREPAWPELVRSGAGCLYLKATEGATYTDPTFRERHAAAVAAGLPVGAYHFATGAPVADQVAHFTAVLDSVAAGGLLPVLDLESYPDERDALAFAHQFIDAMAERGGCVLYTYLSFWSSRLGHGPLPAVPLWIARYNGALYDGAAGERLRDQYADQIKGWQTTYQGGAWPGCGGRVDVNLLTADGIAPFRAPRDHVVTDRYWVAESPLDASSVDIYAIDPDQRAENPAAVATVNIRRALRFATEAEAQAWCEINPAPRFSPSLYEDRKVTQ